SICITIEEYCPALHTDDCSGWAHFVAVSRYVKLESPDDITVSIEVLAPFGYTDDMYFLGDDRTLITEGFINTEERETITEDEAIELGSAEMTQMNYEYVDVTVAYDKYEDMWRVEFLSSETEETVVLVYIRSNGVTEAIVTENNVETDSIKDEADPTEYSFEDDLKNLSHDNIIPFIEKYRKNYRSSILEIDGKSYGRVISSSDSPEDAVSVCTSHFTSEHHSEVTITKNTVVECNVIYESELFYGIYVKWEHFSGDSAGVRKSYYDENVISFKKSVADITAGNSIYNDRQSYNIITDDGGSIEQILLFLYNEVYVDNIWMRISDILQYETVDNENEFIMHVYSYLFCGGDWDMSDEYTIVYQTIIVDKATGTVTFEEAIKLNTYYH
ncbi:MAG: hypothetical protein IKL24_04705, partial [Clostridia bacterium]|nr:hypothetical protein [Clostridia bacterium]